MSRVFWARMRSVACVAVFVALVCIVLAVGSRAHAAPIFATNVITTPLEPDPTGGAIVAGPLVTPFSTGSGGGFFAGTLTSTAYQNDPLNPYGPNLITLVYKLTNDITSATSIGRMTNVGFAGFLTDVSYRLPGLPSTTTDRSSVAGFGNVLGWVFSGASGDPGILSPGMSSAELVVQTNAPGVDTALANIIDGSVVQALSLRPDLSIIAPEPSSLGLLVLVGAMSKRRRIA